MYIKNEETICACATVPGTGAISIIRLSGVDALEIADKVVSVKGRPICESDGYTIRFGVVLLEDGTRLDEVLASVFKAPHSYTGENCVEISCHASSYIADRLIHLLLSAGARLAEPGEFTLRAFMNGKMDLAQAEAVADVIASSSRVQHRVAMNQLRGGYSSELSGIRADLLELASLLELELDFSEEDVEFADRSRLGSLLDSASKRCEKLAASFRMGNAIKNGVPVAIVGAPNSGKSTLLNAFLRDERAIVSDIPGTTRDTVEETAVIDGVLFRFIDTAGIREADDVVEKMGIERALKSAKAADIVLGVIDGSSFGFSPDAFSPLMESVASIMDFENQKLILIANKADLAVCGDGCALEYETGSRSGDGCPGMDAGSGDTLSGADRATGVPFVDDSQRLPDGATSYDSTATESGGSSSLMRDNAENKNVIDSNINVLYTVYKGITIPVVRISAKLGTGLESLEKLISTQVSEAVNSDAVLVTNARHAASLSHAASALSTASTSLSSLTPDLAAEDLRAALISLGEITGEISTDEVLGNIFRNFCIGK